MQLANFFLLKFFKNSRKILLKKSNMYLAFNLTAQGCLSFKNTLLFLQPYINFTLIALTQKRFFNFFSLICSFSLNIKQAASSLAYILSLYFFIQTFKYFSFFFDLIQVLSDFNLRLGFCCINNRLLVTDVLQRFRKLFMVLFCKYYFFKFFISFRAHFRALLT